MKIQYTYEEIREKLIGYINDDNELKKVFKVNLNLLGKIRATLEAIGRVIFDFIFEVILSVFNNIYIYSADKEGLIRHLNDEGLEPWKQPEKAKTKVRIGSSTIPDSVKEIPQLSIVSTPGDNSDEIKQFVLLSGGSIDQNTSADAKGFYTIEIDVESLEAGSKYNVPADTITEFVTDIPGIDVVYNTEDSAYGRDEESKDEVRDRLITKKNTTDKGMLSWFILKTKEFSFVTDAVAIPRYAGRGTVGIAFLTSAGLPTQEQMDEVEAFFNNDEIDPAGAHHVVLFEMSTHTWDASITIYFEGDTPEDDELKDTLKIYFKQLSRGEDLIEDLIDNTLISNIINLKKVDITSHSGFTVGEYEYPVLGTITWTKVEYAE